MRSHLRILAILLAFTTLAPGIALAHAHYDHSTPAIGQVMATAPARVDIYTDSEMRKLAGKNWIQVTGPGGNRVDEENTVVDDANRQHFSVGLQPNLPPGRYVVSFQTLSDVDGDTDGGHFAFYVGNGPTEAQKALDAQLSGAPPVAGSTSAGPNTIAIVVGGVAAVLILLAAGGFALRRRKSAHV
jgi:copper resistance protein C